MDALTSTLMSLSMKDVLDIHATKKTTTLTSMLANRDRAGLLKDERYLLDLFYGNRDGRIVMDKTTDTSFYRKVTKFTRYIMKAYGRDYHRSNAGWGLLGMAASIAIIVFVMNQPVSTNGPIFLALYSFARLPKEGLKLALKLTGLNSISKQQKKTASIRLILWVIDRP